ncbi:Tlg2-vesicle protein [Neurospora sp. IMI 360204]|nr:Tlg2-vesicle protein [Neurospora sp. IMI 360204]
MPDHHNNNQTARDAAAALSMNLSSSSPRQATASPRSRDSSTSTTATHSPTSSPGPGGAGEDLPQWARPSASNIRRLSSGRPYSVSRHASHHRSSSAAAAGGGGGRGANLKALALRAVSTGLSIAQQAVTIFLGLSLLQKIAILVALAIFFILSVVALVYSHAIFASLGPLAEKWRALPFGWLICFGLVFMTAFPPIIGYSTAVTVAGFVYGFPWGWPIAAAATVAGSTCSFLASRGVLAGYVNRLVGRDKRFVALGQVLRRDGLGVLAMVRFSPLPYSLSNGFLATVPRLRVGGFAVATAMATPKLFVHIFIGSRLALLASSGDKMTTRDRAINYISMLLFGAVGAVVGYLIWKRTMSRAEELAHEDGLDGIDSLAAAAGTTAAGEVHRTTDGTLEVEDDEEEDYADLEGNTGGRLLVGGNAGREGDLRRQSSDSDISLWETDRYRDSWDEEANLEGRK